MPPILTRRAVVAAKLEVTEGTAETLAAADANFLVREPRFEADIPMDPRENLDASLSPHSSVPGAQMARLTFRVELKGSGAAGTAPALGKLLKACGFGETVVPATSVSYEPISTGIQSLTMALYRDGKRFQMRGARGTFVYEGRDGAAGVFNFTFSGVYDGVTDVPMLTGTGIETTLPPALLNAAFAVHGFSAKLSSLSIDIGNAITMRSDISKPEGYFSAALTGRAARGTMDPEDELVATHDWYGRWKAGTTGNLTFQHAGGVGNICTVTAPKVQYARIAPASRDGVETLGLDFLLVRSVAGGNDEVKFAFT